LGLLQPWHVTAFVDEREGRIFDQRVRFTDVRFTGQILPPLEEKHGRRDRFEVRPEVIPPLGLEKRWWNAEIVIPGLEFRRHLKRFLAIVEGSNCLGAR